MRTSLLTVPGLFGASTLSRLLSLADPADLCGSDPCRASSGSVATCQLGAASVRAFPGRGGTNTPWRWRNAGAEALGQWLLEARHLLVAGQSVDLSTGPPAHVTWVQTLPPTTTCSDWLPRGHCRLPRTGAC